MPGSQCPICLQEAQNPTSPDCCLHTFCQLCLQKWLEVKNCCPLCISLIDSIPRNRMKLESEAQFDHSLIILEQEMDQIYTKIKGIKAIILRKSQGYAHRIHFPRAKLDFTNRLIRRAEQKYSQAQRKIHINDPIGSTVLIQEITEIVMQIEHLLNGEHIIFDQESPEEYYSGSESDEERHPYHHHKSQAKTQKPKKKSRI